MVYVAPYRIVAYFVAMDALKECHAGIFGQSFIIQILLYSFGIRYRFHGEEGVVGFVAPDLLRQFVGF